MMMAVRIAIAGEFEFVFDMLVEKSPFGKSVLHVLVYGFRYGLIVVYSARNKHNPKNSLLGVVRICTDNRRRHDLSWFFRFSCLNYHTRAEIYLPETGGKTNFIAWQK